MSALTMSRHHPTARLVLHQPILKLKTKMSHYSHRLHIVPQISTPPRALTSQICPNEESSVLAPTAILSTAGVSQVSALVGSASKGNLQMVATSNMSAFFLMAEEAGVYNSKTRIIPRQLMGNHRDLSFSSSRIRATMTTNTGNSKIWPMSPQSRGTVLCATPE